MSADNGVYIAKFKDGYRVIEAGAIDNLDYYPSGSLKEKEIWFRYFSRSPVYNTKEDAILAAHKIAEGCDILEYGVVDLGDGVEWADIDGVELNWE